VPLIRRSVMRTKFLKSANDVLKALESCFDADELGVMVAFPSEDAPGIYPVRVTHNPSGRAFVGMRSTQIESKIHALLQLLNEDFSTQDGV
jgi:hypothetical protein